MSYPIPYERRICECVVHQLVNFEPPLTMPREQPSIEHGADAIGTSAETWLRKTSGAGRTPHRFRVLGRLFIESVILVSIYLFIESVKASFACTKLSSDT